MRREIASLLRLENSVPFLLVALGIQHASKSRPLGILGPAEREVRTAMAHYRIRGLNGAEWSEVGQRLRVGRARDELKGA
jgi:hypothetical protein